MKKTIKHTVSRYVGTFKVGNMVHNVDIPKGTRCTRINEGATAGKYWVDDLSWIDPKDSFLKHDAYFYGIVIEPECVE